MLVDPWPCQGCLSPLAPETAAQARSSHAATELVLPGHGWTWPQSSHHSHGKIQNQSAKVDTRLSILGISHPARTTYTHVHILKPRITLLSTAILSSLVSADSQHLPLKFTGSSCGVHAQQIFTDLINPDLGREGPFGHWKAVWGTYGPSKTLNPLHQQSIPRSPGNTVSSLGIFVAKSLPETQVPTKALLAGLQGLTGTGEESGLGSFPS